MEYVSICNERLSEWKGDTVIGADVSHDIVLLTDCLEESIASITELMTTVGKFVSIQEGLNSNQLNSSQNVIHPANTEVFNSINEQLGAK